MNENKIGLRIVSALVLIVAIAGLGFFAFRAGVTQGSPITIQAPSGESMPVPYAYYGYGYGMPFHRPFGFGFFGLLMGLFLFFVALRALRVLFWGPRWGHMAHMGHRGPWGRHWEGGVPPMFDEWHKRAHEASAGEKETKE